MNTQHPPNDVVVEGIAVLLDDLGVTLEQLDARRGQFRSDTERRAWHLANALRHDSAMS